MIRFHAIHAIHMNYRWRGVWVWLKGRHHTTGERGWVRVVRDPKRVIAEQEAIAEGVWRATDNG